MKNKKIILYYLLEFVLTLSILLTIILLILKITILNKKYLVNIFEKTNYYRELYLDINTDLENYIMQSGFDNSIINDLFTETELKKVINKNVDNFYKGENIIVDTDILKNKLENNINDYLDEIKITITDKEAINLFVNEIETIYKNRIILNKEIVGLSKSFYNINKILNLIFLGLIIFNMVIFIFTKVLFKKIALSIPILSSMSLLLISYYLLLSNININSIVFWNNYVSNVIKYIFWDLNTILKYGSIIIIVLELIKIIILGNLRNKI